MVATIDRQYGVARGQELRGCGNQSALTKAALRSIFVRNVARRAHFFADLRDSTAMRVAASRVVPARAERVYALLADYRVGHRSILPTKYFIAYEVEQGGVGAGTIVSTSVRVLGSTRSFRLLVSEPEPGRLLAETDAATGVTTTFTIIPAAAPEQAEVTIATELPDRPGIAGWLERRLSALVLPKIYRAELEQLASVLSNAGSRPKT